MEAAKLRGRHPISLPDAYCLATAKHTASTPVSFDQKITRAAEREHISAMTAGSRPAAYPIFYPRTV